MELFLTNSGPRVDINKRKGLFSKTCKANRYGWLEAVGSRSEGQDLIKLRSNPGRWYRIGRLRAIAAYGGGGDRREQGSRGGGLAGDAQTGAPGVVSTRVWVGWHLCDMGKLMGPKAGLGR